MRSGVVDAVYCSVIYKIEQQQLVGIKKGVKRNTSVHAHTILCLSVPLSTRWILSGMSV